jgi:ligand-binding SRPBCC domain-containing protein
MIAMLAVSYASSRIRGRTTSLQVDYILERTQRVPAPLEEAFAFFSQARNLEAITPPWLRFEVLRAPAELRYGSLIHYRLELYRVPIHWLTRIATWQPSRSFVDEQIAGPYPLWEHTHRFSSAQGGTEIYDHVRYRVPGGPLAPVVQRRFVGRWLTQIFDYRAERLQEILG